MTLDLIESCRPGGLVLFAGGRDPFHAGPGAVLSDLIDAVSHSQYSHAAVCMPSGGAPPLIYESTIEGGISGPQENDLTARVEQYVRQGGHAWLFPFLPQFQPNWDGVASTALAMIAQRKAGKLPYNVRRLFGDAMEMSWVFDLIALPADGIIAYLAAHSKGVVCSEMAGLLMQGGNVPALMAAAQIPWLPNVRPPGQPIGDSPQDLGMLPIYLPTVQLA
jgi:hypothetical protein